VPNAPRIELPRPAIIAAFGVLLLALTFVITKPGDNSGSVPAQTGSAATDTSTTPSDTSTTATPSKPEQPRVVASAGLPREVARAIDRKKVVVLFFYEPAGADDQATRAAIRTARGVKPASVRVFTDVVGNISDYRRVVGSLGISQTPVMVIVDRDRNAQIYEGYLDDGTIRQSVRDVL
jgi:hypothetical protein